MGLWTCSLPQLLLKMPSPNGFAANDGGSVTEPERVRRVAADDEDGGTTCLDVAAAAAAATDERVGTSFAADVLDNAAIVAGSDER